MADLREATSEFTADAPHTPGPWSVGYKAYDVTAITAKGEMKVCDIRGWGHLTGKGFGALGLKDEDAEAIQCANARLIAAAPDLLDACKAVAESGMRNAAYDLCIAAIAKAVQP